jgi:hypothetical protein
VDRATVTVVFLSASREERSPADSIVPFNHTFSSHRRNDERDQDDARRPGDDLPVKQPQEFAHDRNQLGTCAAVSGSLGVLNGCIWPIIPKLCTLVAAAFDAAIRRFATNQLNASTVWPGL